MGNPGGTLTCAPGTWQGSPDSYQYNWKSDGQPVKATTGGETYQVLPEDVGHSISCVVSATNSAGSADSPVSNEVMIAEAAAQGEPQQAQSNQQQSSQPQQTSEQVLHPRSRSSRTNQ